MAERNKGSIIKIFLLYAVLVIFPVIGGELAATQQVHVGLFTKAAYENLANISTLSVSVPPNPESTLALQLMQREGDLSARESALVEREKEFGAKYEDEIAHNKRLTLFVMGGVSVLLLILILLNFFLDMKRGQTEEAEKQHADHRGEFTTRL